MPAAIAIQPIPHMHELFSDHDFQRLRRGAIDAWKIDQDEMCLEMRVVDECAADTRIDPASKPHLESSSIGRKP